MNDYNYLRALLRDYSEIEANKKVIDTVLMRQSNLVSAGVKNVSDMKEIAITFEYEINKKKSEQQKLF